MTGQRAAVPLGALICAALVAAAPRAARALSCAQLPQVAWDTLPELTLSFAAEGVSMPRVPPAKELYLQALCGVQPEVVTDLVARGEGAALSIPDALAASLDAATPYLPAVRYVYVRGGGAQRPVIVVLFADGVDSPVFKAGAARAWSAAEVAVAASHWNTLPYDFVARAARWLHDVAAVGPHFSVDLSSVDLGALTAFAASQAAGRAFNRALASPLGSMLMPDACIGRGVGVWVHELAHYNHYVLEGVEPFVYPGAFGAISRRSRMLGAIPIPFTAVEKYPAAQAHACGSGGAPYGYVTEYARCGEWAFLEDFAETLCTALGVTQGPRAAGWATYDAADLYGRGGGADSAVLAQKIAAVAQAFSYHDTNPMDADGDGWLWQQGLAPRDCDDGNPVIGTCHERRCTSAGDCDDGELCRVGTCAAGRCRVALRDSDADGVADARCGGDDCDDLDATAGPGTFRPCATDCATGLSTCLQGQWSACSAPRDCACVAGAIRVEPCGLCGAAERRCDVDGAWGPLGDCADNASCTPDNPPP